MEGEGSEGNRGHISQLGMGAPVRSWAMRPCSSVVRAAGAQGPDVGITNPPGLLPFASHFNSFRVSFSQLPGGNKSHSSLLVKGAAGSSESELGSNLNSILCDLGQVSSPL